MPRFYLRIIPPYLPWHEALNYTSGLAEIVLGLFLLFPSYSNSAAWGIIGLLIAIFPANIYHLTSLKPAKANLKWILYLRLPFQGILILWAWWHT
jgi:uncharacterized membrane protein